MTTMCSWYPLGPKTKKGLEFFKSADFWKKGWTITHEKYHFLLDMDFLVKEIASLTQNFT
jgi:hypothetical protein